MNFIVTRQQHMKCILAYFSYFIFLYQSFSITIYERIFFSEYIANFIGNIVES